MLHSQWKRWLACGLLAGALGCANTGKKSATDGPPLASLGKTGAFPEKPPNKNPLEPEPEVRYTFFPGSKPAAKPIQPATFIASGNYRDELAEKQDLDPRDRDDCRVQARQAYQQALAADPKYRPAMVAMAKSYASEGDAPKAMEWYGKALQQNSKDASVWFEQGMTQARFKDFSNAAASLRQAVKHEPDNKKYQRSLGMTLARMGKCDEAVAALSRCMSEAEARYTVARMLRHMDQAGQAGEQLHMALKANPTFMPAHDMLREMRDGAGQPVQAAVYHEPTQNRMPAAQPADGGAPISLPPVLIGGGSN